MAKFRKKPVEIEAVQWVGKQIKNEKWFIEAEERGIIRLFGDILLIKTLEGEMTAQIKDWIIRGVAGEIYSCKPEIFEKTYEAVEKTL